MRVGNDVCKATLKHILHFFIVVSDEVGGTGFFVNPDVFPFGVADEFAAVADQTADCFKFVRLVFPRLLVVHYIRKQNTSAV